MSDPLRRILRALEPLSEATGHPLVLIGGLARGAWAEPRTTADADVLYAGPDLASVVHAAPLVGLSTSPEEVENLARAGMTRLRLPDLPRGPTRLDVIHADHPFYQRVVGRSRAALVLGLEVRVASAEDIILLKVLADRPQDRADVAALIEACRGALDLELLRTEAELLELDLPAALEETS